MEDRFSRTELLIGKDGMEKLFASRVAVFGLGGVGSYVVEALARSGIGALDLVDHDTVSASNINRQIFATEKTVGRYKSDVAAERVAEINPACKVRPFRVFFSPETERLFDFCGYDYIVDAIDTVTGKIALAQKAELCQTPIISSMGTGNKLDPTKFETADLFETSVCPLARVMRRELKKAGIKRLKVVYSKEEPVRFLSDADGTEINGRIPGSISFVPSSAGLILAGEVVKELLRGCPGKRIAKEEGQP